MPDPDIVFVKRRSIFESTDESDDIEIIARSDAVVYADAGLTNKEINNLRSHRYTDMITKVKGCGICMTDLDRPSIVTELACSHMFHSKCVIQWLLENNNCPLCRQRVVCRS